MSKIHDPCSYKQASKDARWVTAMQHELDALELNKTWELTTLPAGKKAIDSKWVYRVKYKPNGEVDRFKARLVARGYTQVAGLDYLEIFSPVAKVVTVRMFIAIATCYQWTLHQLDINNAFLHGHLKDEVYLSLPEGYSKGLPGQVCKLNRSLYGLKQASREWNLEFTSKLIQYGFHQSPHDFCLFTKGSGSTFLALLVYVDDMLLTGPSEVEIQKVKHYLDSLFTIKDLGHAKYFLGVEIARSDGGTFLCQRKYILDIISDTHLQMPKL